MDDYMEAVKITNRISYCGVSFSGVAFGFLLYFTVVSSTRRTCDLHLCWLIATGLKVLSETIYVLLTLLEYQRTVMMLLSSLSSYLLLSSYSWLLAGSYIAVRRSQGCQTRFIIPAALFSFLATVQVTSLSLAARGTYLTLLYAGQLGLTIFGSAVLYAYSLWSVRANAESRGEVIIHLAFALVQLFCAVPAIVFYDIAVMNDVFNFIDALTGFLYVSSLICFDVFIFAIIFFCYFYASPNKLR